MMRTAREKSIGRRGVDALEEAGKSFMPYGSKKTIRVNLHPAKEKTLMRESALRFYQKSLMPARAVLRKLVGLLS